MDEFLALEKKCKKLKTKKILKFFIFTILIIVLIIAGYLFISKNQSNIQTIKHQVTEINKIKKEKKAIEVNKTTIEVKKLVEVDKTKIETKKEVNKTKEIKTIQKKVEINKTKIIPQVKKIKKDVKTESSIKENKTIDIPKWNIELDLDKISFDKPKKESKTLNKTIKPKQVFKTKTITFDKALKLAKFYYDNNKYENSIKWCKIAANIDNNNEKIWKLYALNLEKLNQKEKAIKVLKTYLKYKNSKELQIILKRLEK